MQRLWYFKAMSTVTPTLFLTICDLLSFLFCLLIMLGDGPSFHGCQVPHLPWQKISRKGVKSQAKMTHLWTQVSKGDSSPWQQERSQYPMCGALLCRKEWGVGKQANWEQSSDLAGENKLLYSCHSPASSVYLLPFTWRELQISTIMTINDWLQLSLQQIVSNSLYIVVFHTWCYGQNVKAPYPTSTKFLCLNPHTCLPPWWY